MLKRSWINPIHSKSFLGTDCHLKTMSGVLQPVFAFGGTAVVFNTNGWYSKRRVCPVRKIPSHFKLRAKAPFIRVKQVFCQALGIQK